MKLSAVTFLVPDYDQATAFFVQGLGWRLVSDQDHGSGKRWILVEPPAGGSPLLLARATEAEQIAALGHQAGGRVGFFLSTDDFEGTHALLERAGAVFEEPPRRESYGVVAVWRDPWGNRWDLLGPP
ncbi:VOC family protein [Rubellimicrobium arenae]|uniref:VOC family protein n=1 Tax=Rubellimicrobium arenae TaxID=2817372 RepID=UPI001B30A166